MTNKTNYTLKTSHLLALVVGRVLIGWHFLYEGWVKVFNPDWSSRAFLLDSQGIFKSWFMWMANTDGVLQTVDFLNQWGLVLIGLSLILGLFSRVGAIAGATILLLFYLSHPPFVGLEYLLPAEGSNLIVNKNLIEMSMLIILALIPTSKFIGVDRLIRSTRKR